MAFIVRTPDGEVNMTPTVDGDLRLATYQGDEPGHVNLTRGEARQLANAMLRWADAPARMRASS